LHPTSQTGGATFGDNWADAVQNTFNPAVSGGGFQPCPFVRGG
jgi:hypothetical protein